MASSSGPVADLSAIRQLFDDYLRMYASRDDRLTEHFSDDFTGFTGGGDFLVKDRAAWVAITRQDFAQVKDPIRIELKDVAVQSLSPTIAVATGFFTIHLPIKDHILSRETARLVLVFRRESAGWKITHSSISIPYYLVREGEVYPLKELVDRNQSLEKLVAERTTQLSAANEKLHRTNENLAQEIRGHQQAEEALQRSEERYRSILNASPDDITITDVQGRIVMVSPAAATIFRCDPIKKFLGLPVTDFLVPDDRPRALSRVALRLDGTITGPSEYVGLRPDGSTFPIEVNTEFIRNPAGAPTGMVLIVRDISGRKQAEIERTRLEAQNRQLQKAESLACMAGAIAHHFNNQMQVVMMALDLATNELAQNVSPTASLDLAMQSAHKAADVSSLMLTYLGQVSVNRATLDLSDVCRRGVSALRAVVPANVDLQVTLPSPGPLVHADPRQFQQLLTNLLTNAWEACDREGSIIRLTVSTVAASAVSGAHRFPVDWQPHEPDYACLEVADAGCGISEPDIEKIFDPFFTSKFAGRGMGLAVVMGVTRAHDGAITVESELGRGSIFRVFLPVLNAAESK